MTAAAIDITTEQQKALLVLLRRFIPGVAVWAYGSRVKWTARPNSDLDLVVFTALEQRPLVSELKDELAESSHIPFLVDLHVWDEIPERFREIIRKEYVVLQEAEEKLGREMPEKWRRTTWGEEISLEYGKALRGYEKTIGRIRVYGTNGPVGWTTQPLAPGPGVILGRKGAYRGVHYSADPFFVIDTAYYVVPKTALDMRWLYYAIRHYKLGEINDGSPIPSTTRAAVYVMGLAVPPPPEQRAIAAVLGALDDKIESNRRTSRALERLAQAIFRAWFVDFEPVKAKGVGARSFPGMPQEAFDALPSRFVESELGLIPEGWGVECLDSIATVGSGKRPTGRSNESIHECNIPLYGGGGRMGYVPLPLYEKPILFTGRVGTLGLIFRTSEPSWPSDNTLIVEPLDGFFDFTYFSLKEFDLVTLNRGSTQPLLTQTDLKRQQIVRPSERIVSWFASIVSPMFAMIDSNLHESNKLVALRDYLLPKLLSGEVRVELAEKSVISILETTAADGNPPAVTISTGWSIQ